MGETFLLSSTLTRRNHPDSFNRENPSHGKISLSAIVRERAAT